MAQAGGVARWSCHPPLEILPFNWHFFLLTSVFKSIFVFCFSISPFEHHYSNLYSFKIVFLIKSLKFTFQIWFAEFSLKYEFYYSNFVFRIYSLKFRPNIIVVQILSYNFVFSTSYFDFHLQLLSF